MILILGASGFIGEYLFKRFKQENFDVIVLNKEIRLRKISYFFVISLLIASFFYHTKWYYTQNVSWVKVQKWINNNLGEKCIFLTPFKHQGFRVYAKRAYDGYY